MADRRFAIAEALAAEGDHQATIDLLGQTLELTPQWAPAWLALGEAHERAGDSAAADAAYRRAAALDQDGALGAAARSARIGSQADADLPATFVRTLFDDYADRFDSHLVDTLRYTGPGVIVAALRKAGVTKLGTVLDAGCGTGLVARAIADQATAIDGVDLSPRMIQQAELTRLYRRLSVGDIGVFLRAQSPHSFDAVVAADVLVYFRDLACNAAEVCRTLKQGGVFAFTVQRGSNQDVELGEDMRFRHAEDYVRRTITDAGLEPLVFDHVSTRLDRGVPVPGLVVVARRP